MKGKKGKKGSIRILHIGKKVPKGYEELDGGVHIGKGIWILPMRKVLK